MIVRHVILDGAGGEHAACGLAFDAFGSGDHDSDDEFVDAKPGLRVTCPHCCETIRKMRESMKGLRLAVPS